MAASVPCWSTVHYMICNFFFFFFPKKLTAITQREHIQHAQDAAAETEETESS